MGDLVPIIVAIVTSVGTIAAAAFGARKLSASRNPDADGTSKRWREQAELEAARADLLSDQLREEREAHASDIGTLARERERLGTTQHDLDDCSRQRDNAYARIRELERRKAGES